MLAIASIVVLGSLLSLQQQVEGQLLPICTSSRKPSFNGSVDFHFFNNKGHSKKTLGCSKGYILSLDITRSIQGNFDDVQELVLEGKSIQEDLIQSRQYEAQYDTYILIHGYLNTWSKSGEFCRLKDLILNNSKANVLIVDWSSGAIPTFNLDYSQAVSNTRFVGNLLANLIDRLAYLSGQKDLDRFHLIGHSLGAHLCGFTGYALRGALGRITGIDAAGPCFTSDDDTEINQQTIRTTAETGMLGPNKRRLSRASAKLVVALHTDISLLGLDENIGHYDVFVNGGAEQSCNRANRICAHSFGLKIMENFAPKSARNSKTLDTKCYLMAYTCRSWHAFRAGECGLCRDDDGSCLNTNIDSDRPKTVPQLESNLRQAQPFSILTEYKDSIGDSKFNGEGYRDSDMFKQMQLSNSPKTLFANERLYIRTSGSSPTCRYHYQILVGVTRTGNGYNNTSRRFYMQIPLEQSVVKLVDGNGVRTKDRLVRVSHAVPRDSTTRKQLDVKLKLRDNLKIDLYTALITFKSSQEKQQQCLSKVKNIEKDGWILCQPLVLTQETRLWSSNKQWLQSVKFVAIKYMSARNEQARRAKSIWFEGNLGRNRVIQSRSQVKPDSIPTMAGFKSTNLLSSVWCLVPIIGAGRSDPRCTSTQENLQELQFSLKL